MHLVVSTEFNLTHKSSLPKKSQRFGGKLKVPNVFVLLFILQLTLKIMLTEKKTRYIVHVKILSEAYLTSQISYFFRIRKFSENEPHKLDTTEC